MPALRFPSRHRIATTLLWTLALLLLTNIFWSFWGAMDIDHPTIYQDGRRLGSAVFSESAAIRFIEVSLPTRTTYHVRIGPHEPVTQPGVEPLHPYESLAPGWIRRRFSSATPVPENTESVKGSFQSVGWPVRLLWCGSAARDGNSQQAVRCSGIRLREPKQFRERFDGIMPLRPILFGQLCYAGFWFALLAFSPVGFQRTGEWLRTGGWTRERCRRTLGEFASAARRGSWLNRRSLGAVFFYMMSGALVSLAVAWSCAAWLKPTGKVSYAQLTAIGNGEFMGESRLESFGKSLIFRATTREFEYVTDTILNWAQWDTHRNCHAELQAGWPLRSWRCRNPGTLELRTAFGVSSAGNGGTATIGGIRLKPFALVGPGTAARSWRALPCQPLWRGLIGSSAFFAAVLWLAIHVPGALKRMRRFRREQCPECAYPVGTSSVCTECGTTLPTRASQ